jgi:phosphatidylinositol-binding clathrin assembly protein
MFSLNMFLLLSIVDRIFFLIEIFQNNNHFVELIIFLSYVMQAENLAEFYDYCKGLDLARNFQFPTLRQVPFVSYDLFDLQKNKY